jgi:hypothetical protein
MEHFLGVRVSRVTRVYFHLIILTMSGKSRLQYPTIEFSPSLRPTVGNTLNINDFGYHTSKMYEYELDRLVGLTYVLISVG